jgi:hypothetical protein
MKLPSYSEYQTLPIISSSGIGGFLSVPEKKKKV